MNNALLMSKLHQKIVLANILCAVVDEYKGISPDEAKQYIDDIIMAEKEPLCNFLATLPGKCDKILVCANIYDMQYMNPNVLINNYILITGMRPVLPEFDFVSRVHIVNILISPMKEYHNCIIDRAIEIFDGDYKPKRGKKSVGKPFFFTAICLGENANNCEIPIVKYLAKTI